MLICAGFLLAWIPYAVVSVWSAFGQPDSVPIQFSVVPTLLAKSAAMYNPIIYQVIDCKFACCQSGGPKTKNSLKKSRELSDTSICIPQEFCFDIFLANTSQLRMFPDEPCPGELSYSKNVVGGTVSIGIELENSARLLSEVLAHDFCAVHAQLQCPVSEEMVEEGEIW
ncbi:hypothetical protein WISP_72510 [Willisornis vidua]|uniref:G-protein coupled receptors family 1 profile domain-containing protein n=1 Tax=Willisornis vidua TaxID=1566151 RepID=A0ABQ9DBZ5_9PASS|nr:hypothetical protein WISP_72510 [Willisornis vidua]